MISAAAVKYVEACRAYDNTVETTDANNKMAGILDPYLVATVAARRELFDAVKKAKQ